MTLVGHLGGSVIAACIFEQCMFDSKATPTTLGLSVLIGMLPDLDGLLALVIGPLRPRQRLLHHRYPTHTPLFYLLLTLVVWQFRGTEFAVLFGALTLVHLFLDSWGTDDGIMWLWPLSSRQFSLFAIDLHVGGIFGWRYYWRYVRYWRTIVPEMALLVGGILLYLQC
jgi:hypothetical protein